MTYSSGGLIEATDYNGFVSTTAGANLNGIWSVGSGDRGWGQTALATASVGSTITATQWATLVNSLAAAGSQTGTILTSRTAPVAGNTISALPAINTDLTNCTTNRGNAPASGTEYGVFSGTTSKISDTGSGTAGWLITFTHTVVFASADAARYFFNAGGIIRIKYGKSGVVTDTDPDWNQLAGWCGSINLTGRVNGASQTIAGTVYSGTTRIGGTGGTQNILTAGTGWYDLTGSPTTIFRLNNSTSPYSGEYIQTTATATTSTVLSLSTTWFSDGSSGAGTSANISGGTPTASPSTTITGTAPTTLVTYIPPSTTYLTNSWGTPSIFASVA